MDFIQVIHGTKHKALIDALKAEDSSESLMKIASFYEKGVEGEVRKSSKHTFRWLKKAARKIPPLGTYDNFLSNESSIEAARKIRELGYSTHQKKQKQKRNQSNSCQSVF